MRICQRMVAVAGVLAMAGAACSDDRPTSRSGAPSPSGCGLEALAEETGPVAVSVGHFFPGVGNGAASPVFADLVDRFNRAQQKVKVEVRGFGSPQELVRSYYSVPRGKSGGPDLVQLPPPATRAAADTGRVVPVQACMEAAGTDGGDFVPSALAATRSEGTQWGLPDGHLADLLLYDRNAFARAGLNPDRPPSTFAELRTAAERLRAAGVPRPLARVDTFLLLESSGVQFSDAANGHGGPGRRAAFDTPDAREIVRTVQRLVDDGLVVPANPQGTWSDDLLAIGRGEAAMTIHNALDLKDVSNALAQGQAPGFRLGVAAVPTLHGPARSRFSAGAFLLSSGTSLARRAAAWTFLDWFQSPAQQARWHAGTPYFPTRRSAVADPAVASLWARQPELSAGWMAITDEGGLPPPFVGPQARIGQELGPALDDVFRHRATPEEALARAATKADRHLAEYADDPGGYVRWLTGS